MLLLPGVLALGSEAPATAPASPAVSERLQPPLPVWPSDFETITTRAPVFCLSGSTHAAGYRVEVAREPSFTRGVAMTGLRITDPAGIAPMVAVPYVGEALGDGQYFWRCFASGAKGEWTTPANWRTFFVAANDPEAIVAPERPVHPRLLVSAEELPALRSRVRASTHLLRGWQYLSNAAMSMLEATPPDESDTRRDTGAQGNYGASADWYHRHLVNTAFIAVLNEDERLVRKSVEMLMAACSYDRWLGPRFDDPRQFDPPWHAAIETAVVTQSVATAYDLLYAHLTEAQRQVVRTAIAEKGVRPLVAEWADPIGSSRIPGHQIATGNAVMICAASAGVGAIALLGEHPDAPDWTRLARNRVRAWLHDRGGDYAAENPHPGTPPVPIPVSGPSKPNFGRDGGYKESIADMNEAMQYACCFADALRRITSQNLFRDFPADLLEPVSWSVLAWPREDEVRSAMLGFGDGGDRPNYADLYSCLIANTGDSRAAWLYNRTVPVPLSPWALTWHRPHVVESPPDASIPMRAFRDTAQVFCRSGWGPFSPAAAIRFHQSRGRGDLGTFSLFGAGRPTLVDSDMTGGGFKNSKESPGSMAHNVVRVDDAPQAPADGRLLGAVGTSLLSAASGQLAAAYPDALRSWTRDLLMLPGNWAIVFDRLQGQGAHRYDLLLQPSPPFALAGPSSFVVGERPVLTMLSVESDEPLKMTRHGGDSTQVPGQYVRFTPPTASESQSFVMLCRWALDRQGRATEGSLVHTAPGRWRADRLDTASRLLVRLGGADDDAVTTDARVAAIYDSGHRVPRRHVVLMDGRELKVGGLEFLRSTHPVSAAVEYGLPLRADFEAAEPARITLPADEQIREVELNGQAVSAAWHDGTITIDIPAGFSQLLGTEFRRPMRRLAPLVFNDLLPVNVPGDAPALRPGVLALSSTCAQEGLQAIDGDSNTAWSSFPGASMPQWMEVRLPRPEPMSRITLETGQACRGSISIWDESRDDWKQLGAFRTRALATAAGILFQPVTVRRLRVTIDEVESPGGAATVHTLRWGHDEPAPPPATAPARTRSPLPAATGAAH